MTDAALSPEEQLIDDIASFTHDPLGYALYAFPWGEDGTELAHASGPREWQADAFREIGEHLQNPATRHQPLMIARASGHGIGKSAFISMLINWGMSTCEDCKVVVTANTDNQLRTKTAGNHQMVEPCYQQRLVYVHRHGDVQQRSGPRQTLARRCYPTV